MGFGYVVKRSENDFVIGVALDEYGSGYNVVPKDVDPDNAYDIEEVRAYCEANPDMVLPKHPMEEKSMLMMERARLEKWLSNHDYIGIKIATGRAKAEEYADKIAEMNEKAERINEIDNLLGGWL